MSAGGPDLRSRQHNEFWCNCTASRELVNKRMKFSRIVTGRVLLLFTSAMLLASSASAQLGAYHIGDVVTNFTLPNRYQWTNDNGQVFTPGSTFRLSDFAGKIVFFEVFAVW